MQVYVELALAENFCMDFVLFCGAKAFCKNPCGLLRIAASSVLGACFAVAFPLFGLNGFWAIAVKLASGAALCAVAGRYKSVKGYLKFTLAFLVISFAVGGALLGIFSLAGVSYEEGGGFLISSVPVGIPLFAALLFALAIKRIRSKFALKHAKNSVICRIYAGENSVEGTGFYDSGNKVYHLGAPVSVIPKPLAEKIVDLEGIKTFTKIHTVAGSRKMAVFTADRIEIDDGENKTVINKVKIGVSPNGISRVVLHPDIAENN